MKTRILLIASTLIFAAVAAGAPTATAQLPANYYQVNISFEHPTMTVPDDTGRADMNVLMELEASGFACPPPGPCIVTFQLKLETFTKWAGASLEPFTAKFQLAAGEPGNQVVKKQPLEEVKLNLAWDLETAPRTGAKQDYIVTASGGVMEPGSVPQSTARPTKSTPMTATLPDRPLEANGSTAVDCQMDPFNSACASAGTTAAAESPAIDAGILLASLAMFAVVFRRRRD